MAEHVTDVARRYKFAIEPAEYNAVGKEAVMARASPRPLGRSLKLPVVSVTGDAVAACFG